MNFNYNHLHFRSGDPDAAAKFYCDNFGAEIPSERPLSTTKSINLSLNGHQLMTISGRAEGEDPVAGSTDPRYGLDHFGFRVDNQDETVAELKRRGADIAVEPRTIRPGVRIAFVRAPDDVRIELLQRD